MVSVGGSFTAVGSAPWASVSATVLIAGQSGLFVPSASPQTWPSISATIAVIGTSGGVTVQALHLHVGSTQVTKAYIGSTQVTKMYLGSTPL
jgi:hypothetical protein